MELNLSLIAVVGMALIVLLLIAAYWLSCLEKSEDKLIKVLYNRIFSGQDDPIIVAVVNKENLTPNERVEALNFEVTPETFTEVKESIEDLEIAATMHYNSAADKVQGIAILEEPMLEEPMLEEPILEEPIIEQAAEDYSFVPQPDLTNIGKDWEALGPIEKVGNYEIYTPTADIFKWRLISRDQQTILTSIADYASEQTCKNGISSAKKTLLLDSLWLQLVVKTQEQAFIPVLKAKNGKLIGEGTLYISKAEALEAVKEIRITSV